MIEASTDQQDINTHAAILQCRRSGWYWRKFFRECRSLTDAREAALTLVYDLETHREEFRRLGFIPPKASLAPGELEDKNQLSFF